MKAKGSVPRSSDVGRIIVSGYDTNLPHDVAVSALTKIFSSCGEITDVFISEAKNTIQSYAFVNILGGEVAVDKAMKLGGSDVGGWNVVVEPYPEIDLGSAALHVEGYDTELSNDDIKSQLIEHFSSCGEVFGIQVYPSKVVLCIEGDGAEDKGLDLDGSVMRGCKLSVQLFGAPSRPNVHPRRVHAGNCRLGEKAKITVE